MSVEKQMSSNDETFSVIKFIQKPVGCAGNYCVVPRKWIKQRHQKIGVLWPKIHYSENIEHYFTLKPECTPSLNWTEYLSELVYPANNYNDGLAYIMKTSNQDIKKFMPSNTKTLNHRKRCHDRSFTNKNINHIPPNRQMKSIIKQASNFHTYPNRNQHINDLLINFTKKMINISSKTPANISHVTFEEGWSSDDDGPSKECIYNSSTTCIMPPEYDQNNSRWTLKHPEKQPGLQKLVEGYEVYVDSKKLNDIRNFSKDEEQLVRLLMLAIFKPKALELCTFSGRKSRGSTPTRPGLDKDGKDAILKYVNCYINEMKLTQFDKPNLIKIMQKKLVEVRNQGRNKKIVGYN